MRSTTGLRRNQVTVRKGQHCTAAYFDRKTAKQLRLQSALTISAAAPEHGQPQDMQMSSTDPDIQPPDANSAHFRNLEEQSVLWERPKPQIRHSAKTLPGCILLAAAILSAIINYLNPHWRAQRLHSDSQCEKEDQATAKLAVNSQLGRQQMQHLQLLLNRTCEHILGSTVQLLATNLQTSQSKLSFISLWLSGLS